MAGKKGRSGRPRKKPLPQPAAPSISESFASKNNSVEQTTGDPFGRIEAELKAQHPEAAFVPQDGQAGAAGVQPLPALEVQAPENLLRFLMQTLYKAEAAAGCVYLGLPLDHSEIFYDEKLVEAQIDPLCQVVKKHFPPDLLRDLNENSPEIMLGIRIFEAQLSFFGKLSKAKKEIAEELAKKTTEAKPSERPPQPVDIPKSDQFRYPSRGEV